MRLCQKNGAPRTWLRCGVVCACGSPHEQNHGWYSSTIQSSLFTIDILHISIIDIYCWSNLYLPVLSQKDCCRFQVDVFLGRKWDFEGGPNWYYHLLDHKCGSRCEWATILHLLIVVCMFSHFFNTVVRQEHHVEYSPFGTWIPSHSWKTILYIYMSLYACFCAKGALWKQTV